MEKSREKSNFDLLLERYAKDQVSEAEKNKIDAWLDSVKTKNKKNFTWEKEDEEELFRKITASIDNTDEIVAYKPKNGGTRPIQTSWIIGIAAAFALLLAASYVVWKTQVSIIEPTAEVEKLILQDGSIVWLRKNSKLTYYESQDKTERHARLTGEALFEVTKDPSRPFIVDCGEIKVRVLGTSFNLKLDSGRVELEVLTGKVNLSSVLNEQGIDVESNHKVIYDGKRLPQEAPIDPAEISRIIAPTEYNMKFKNSSMKEIIPRIEKKFNVTINVDNTRINDCTITADFTDHSLENTLQMISDVLNFNYSIEGSVVRVTGDGCK